VKVKRIFLEIDFHSYEKNDPVAGFVPFKQYYVTSPENRRFYSESGEV
jgi:hypothetical protein